MSSKDNFKQNPTPTKKKKKTRHICGATVFTKTSAFLQIYCFYCNKTLHIQKLLPKMAFPAADEHFTRAGSSKGPAVVDRVLTANQEILLVKHILNNIKGFPSCHDPKQSTKTRLESKVVVTRTCLICVRCCGP